MLGITADPKRIFRRSHEMVAERIPLTDCKMATRMGSVKTNDLWSVNPSMSRRFFSSHQEENTIKTPAVGIIESLSTDYNDKRLGHFEMKLMIKSSLYILKNTWNLFGYDCENHINWKVLQKLFNARDVSHCTTCRCRRCNMRRLWTWWWRKTKKESTLEKRQPPEEEVFIYEELSKKELECFEDHILKRLEMQSGWTMKGRSHAPKKYDLRRESLEPWPGERPWMSHHQEHGAASRKERAIRSDARARL